MEKLNLDVEYKISLGMDGPNVNKSFEQKLNSDLEKKGKTPMSVGTCPLHTISKGLKALLSEIDLNQFAIDLQFFLHIPQKESKIIFLQTSLQNWTLKT